MRKTYDNRKKTEISRPSSSICTKNKSHPELFQQSNPENIPHLSFGTPLALTVQPRLRSKR